MRPEARWSRHIPVIVSLFAGAAVWEIAAHFTTRAFWAPLSETLEVSPRPPAAACS
jgi:hypothetical protein